MLQNLWRLAALSLCCILLSAPASAQDVPSGAATPQTRAAQEAVRAALPFADRQSFDDARRGFMAPLPDAPLKNAQGREIWNPGAYAFLNGDAPDTVNPSLWRQAQLIMQGGLFKVTDRLYQVRNYDISNLTIIEGDTGLILCDPLISAETARAALELYYAHRPRKPVRAVLYSHSHVDHYGGVRGVVDEADVRAGTVRIIAPAGFLEAAVSENVMAGTAMGRRAQYMYGNLLPASPTGHVGSGLGLKTSTGTTTLIPPTETIDQPVRKLVIDGLTFEFLLAPGTEAPAEMHWYIEELRALTAAENCCQTLHNLYTLRGAQTRDAMAWSRALDRTLELWGGKAQVMYGMHHWPVWGQERIADFLETGRDAYRFIHDQTLHLANQGYTMVEIAEMLRFPPELDTQWAVRGYYGSLNHNVKAVYNKYLGWFDGNPAHLHPLPPVESARHYVDFMGGAEAVLTKARAAFHRGEYRWVAQVLDHVVFADPDNRPARLLAADALEQLGYQAESGPWRNFYLTGALELRNGIRKTGPGSGNIDTISAMPAPLFFDYMSICLNAQKAQGKTLRFHMILPEGGYLLTLRRGVVNHRAATDAALPVDARCTLDRRTLAALAWGRLDVPGAVAAGALRIDGDAAKLTEFLSLLERFPGAFPIVTP